MSVDGYVLSDSDRRALRELLAQHRARVHNPRLRADEVQNWSHMPEVHVGKITDADILPIDDVTRPWRGTAQVYRINYQPPVGTGSGSGSGTGTGTALDLDDSPYNLVLQPAVPQVDVFNLSLTATLNVGDWVILVKDKFGSWIAVPTSGGGGSVTGGCVGPIVTAISCVSGSLSVTTKYLRVDSSGVPTLSDTAC